MPKPKVFATHGLFDAARQILQKSCEVQYWTKPERPPREEVLQQVKEKEGLICLLTEKVDWDLDQLVGTDVWGKTLGSVGFGRIGRAVARRASGFQMKVIYTDAVRPAEEVEKELKVEFREMNALLAESDFISVHVPLLPETRGLVDLPKFHRMKPTAFLINTSRGPVVDEAALVAALESGKIAGAGLDVYENEPFIHPGLKRANVVLAPHIAAENVVALFTGQRPPNVLNPEVLKAS